MIDSLIKDKEIPGITTHLITFGQGGLFSPRREYLRVKRGPLVFDICAAPFAKSFFVSWWQGKLRTTREILIAMIPFLGRTILKYERERTYYEMDTEIMHKDIIHQCVLKAVDAMTTVKGMRNLSEEERMIQSNKTMSIPL